jgi:hypothetical protein
MKTYQCPICDNNIEVHDHTKPGERITCPHCFAQLALHKHKGQLVFACAICREPVFDPSQCAECERRRERKLILEEGRL